MNWPNLRFCRRQVVIAVCTCLVLIGFHFHPPQAVTAKPTTNQLEIVAELPQGAEVGNIAVTADKRIFCSVHSFFGNQNRAIEVLDQKIGKSIPIQIGGKPRMLALPIGQVSTIRWEFRQTGREIFGSWIILILPFPQDA